MSLKSKHSYNTGDDDPNKVRGLCCTQVCPSTTDT